MPGVSALPRSLVQPFRKNELVIGSGWRGYFAPYNVALGSGVANTAIGPTMLDLAALGPFDSNNPSTYGFIDLGWIKDVRLTPESKIGQVRSGYRGAVRAQYRGQVGESLEFKFREYARLQYRLATGTNVINLLAGTTAQTTGPVSASGAPKLTVTAYASGVSPYGVGGAGTAATLTVTGSPSGAGVTVGSYIVCDVDYSPTQYGIVGDAGVNVFQNAVVSTDYIRTNSDYVARVTGVAGGVLTLDQPFRGGGSGDPAPYGPGSTSPQSYVQAIKGWSAREGGTFIAEWTGLFLLNTIDGAQIACYYPHLSILQNRDIAGAWAIENVGTTDLGGYELDAQFAALAFDDPLDGETVVGYKAFYPRPLQSPAY